MKLIIAEKPSVAQGIAKVVGANKKENGYMTGNGYVVSWCLGHLIQLKSPDSYIEKEDDDKFWNIEDLPIIPEKFEYELINDAGVKSQYKTLKGLLHDKNISEVYVQRMQEEKVSAFSDMYTIIQGVQNQQRDYGFHQWKKRQ